MGFTEDGSWLGPVRAIGPDDCLNWKWDDKLKAYVPSEGECDDDCRAGRTE